MSSKVKCTCGWSWNKSDSSKKDMYICHECGRDNSNNMKNGGWLDQYADGGTMQEHQENYNDYNISAPEGFQGDGYSNVGRDSSPAWGGQFQEGGEIPIAQKGKKVKYVESKNDPRYKAYQDSLTTYNKYVKELKKTKTKVRKDIDFYNKNKGILENEIEYQELGLPIEEEDKKGFRDVATGISPIANKYIGWKDKSHSLPNALRNLIPKDSYISSISGGIDVYKKPQQQVIVKDNNAPQYKTIHTGEGEGRFEPVQRPTVNAIQNNLQPSGLVYPDNDIKADVPQIRPQARIPKSFDVTSQRQTMSGPSDYYNYNQQGLSVEQALEAKQAADAYNQSVQDKYGNSKNPKAQERLKQLMQDVELTPNYQMGGNVYPVNYVPEAQTGGSFPGATGFSYARTGSIPSEGKYAKKTMASAQNGQEMQYYREGLDFQPKTISKNGGWLDSYDKAQDGKTVKYGTPEYEEAYNKGEIVTKEGVRSPILLDEVVIQNNYKRPRGFWEQYKDKIVEENKDAGVLGAIIGTPISAITSLPQLAATYAFTDKVQRPSEAMDIQNPYGAMAVDAIADPANLIGANILTKENALSKLGKISTSIAPELRQGVNTNGFLDIFKSKKPTTSFAENTTNVSKNLEDLTHAKDWAKQYGYELPENLERIAQSDELTNRTVRGMMNRHNTFVRGVSTNWDELTQRNPEILRHLEGKGIDWQNNPKAAAEYMATHVPIQTGYGRASLNQDVFNQGLDAIYTSNSIPTAEGYTYGQGYITKVKKPTDFSSLDRKEWITQNSPTYHEGALEKNKITYSIKDKDVTKILGNFDTDLNIQRKFVNAQKSKKKLKEFKDEVLKEWEDDLEFYNNNPKFHGGNKEEILKNIKDVKETDFSKIKINENTNNDKITHKLLRTEKTSEEKAYKSFIDDVILNAEKNKSIVNDDVARKLSKELYNKNLEVYPSWKPGAEGIKNAKLFRQHFLNDIQNSDSDVLKELLNKHIGSANYAHYLHLGTPGEKILEPVKSWEITPDIWKNKSRAHTNTYSKKLSAMEEGGVIKDDRGQWDHPGEITEISGDTMATHGYGDIPLYVVPDKGKPRMVQPNTGTQKFPGAKKFTEYPVAQGGTTFNKNVDNSLQYQKDWMNSPMYEEMLNKSTENDWVDRDYAEDRVKNLEELTKNKSYRIRESYDDVGPNGQAGDASTNGIITLYNSSNVNKDFKKEAINHEIGHMTDNPTFNITTPFRDRLIPQSDIDLIEKYNPINLENTERYKKADKLGKKLLKQHSPYNKDTIDYITTPTETRARLNVIRQYAKENNIYDPFTQKVTPEIINKLLLRKHTEKLKGLDDLNSVFGKNKLMNLLNTISQNDTDKDRSVSVAKNGLRQEQKSLQNLDNLTNFTNYNKPQPGGWLNKYN